MITSVAAFHIEFQYNMQNGLCIAWGNSFIILCVVDFTLNQCGWKYNCLGTFEVNFPYQSATFVTWLLGNIAKTGYCYISECLELANNFL
jgi:hypothetical protein